MRFSFFKRQAKWFLGLAVFSLLASCGEAPPSNEELVSRFQANVSVAEEIEQMILNDAASRKSNTYAVGTDRVGDYWGGLTNKWSKEGERSKEGKQIYLTFKEVLEKEDLSQGRYDRYISLFDKLNSERVTVFIDDKNNRFVNILIFRQGLAISGCLMNFSYKSLPPKNWNKKGDGSFDEYISLGNDWYIENSGCNN